jgi:hypothetical protein
MQDFDENITESQLLAEFAGLEAPLARALRAAPPAGLTDRIFNATVLDAPLRHALKPAIPPAGLADRLFDATVSQLGPRSVIGRIGFNRPAARFALAALIALEILAGAWVVMGGSSRQAIPAQTVAMQLQQFDSDLRTAAAPRGQIASKLVGLAVDVESLALNVESDHTGGDLSDTTQSLSDDLSLMEAEIRAF